MNKRILIFFLTAVVLGTGFLGWFFLKPKKHVLTPVAWVRNKPVYQEDIEEEKRVLAYLIKKQVGEIEPKEEETLQKKVFDFLSSDAAVQAEADILDVVVSDDEVHQEWLKQQNIFGGKERFEAYVDAHGMDMAHMKKRIKRYLLREKVKNIRMNPVQIADQEIRDFYASHLHEYVLPKRVKLRRIWVSLEKNATQERVDELRTYTRQMRQVLMDGEDFEGMAQSHSNAEDAHEGGDMGWISEGEKNIPQEVFSLREGEISKIFENKEGFSLYEVDDVVLGKTLSLKDVKQNIKTLISNQKNVQKEVEFANKINTGW
jgi:peptidyl-prolyl cis-trans isomerase SurA